MPRRLLVVDWDYFFPVDYGSALYDWGHSEQWPDAVQQMLWIVRASQFQVAQQPLPGTSGLETSFWSRFRFNPHAIGLVADSNVHAFQPQWMPDVRDVWLFDAHHDCGYHGTRTELVEALYDGRPVITCENWMVPYQVVGASTLHVRYPAWRSTVFDAEPEPLVPVDRAFDDGASLDDPFDAVVVCRSGSWTPPWVDDQFTEFVRACPVVLVPDPPFPLRRDWDASVADTLAEQTVQVTPQMPRASANRSH